MKIINQLKSFNNRSSKINFKRTLVVDELNSNDSIPSAFSKINANIIQDIQHRDNKDVHFTKEERNKLKGIANNANNYIHPSYDDAKQMGLFNVSIDKYGHIAQSKKVTKDDIVALGIPPEDTDTHWTSKYVLATNKNVITDVQTGAQISNDSVFINSVENGKVTSSHKIVGTGATTVTVNGSGDIVIHSTDEKGVTYVHPVYTPRTKGFYKIAVDSSGHVSDATNVSKSDITSLGIASDSLVSATNNGLMSIVDKKKLDGIANSANNYTHPSYTTRGKGLYKVAVDSYGHINDATVVTKADITSLGIPSQDTTYKLATSSNDGLMSHTDKTKLDSIANNANNYVLPTAGNNKLGGVKTSSNVSNPDGYIPCPIINGVVYYRPGDKPTEYNRVTTKTDGLMSHEDKTKLDGIANNANNYVHPSYTNRPNGFYKVTVDTAGHVNNVVAVVQKDITDLKILPLQGGTMTGRIDRAGGGSWISDRNNVVAFGTATSKDTYNPVVGQKTPSGAWTMGNLAANEYLVFNYTTDTNFNAGNNASTAVYLPNEAGTIITSATIGNQNVHSVDGFHASQTAGSKSTCTVTDTNGYLNLNYINSNTARNENPTISQIIVTNGTDNYYRKASLAHLKTSLGAMTPVAHTHDRITSLGNRAEAASGTTGNDPNTGLAYKSSMYMSQSYNDANTPYAYGNIITLAGSGTGQLMCEWSSADSTTGHLAYRSHRDTSTGGWGAWNKILDSANYNSYALPLSGGTVTGNLKVTLGVTTATTTTDYLDASSCITADTISVSTDLTVKDTITSKFLKVTSCAIFKDIISDQIYSDQIDSDLIYGREAVLNSTSKDKTALNIMKGNLVMSNGNISVTGNITGTKVYNAVWNGDYAEVFDYEGEYPEVGDIVSLSSNKKVSKASSDNDQRIIGVCSNTYCILADGDLKSVEKKEKVAVGLLGKLPINIIGRVNIGDYIIKADNGKGKKLLDNEIYDPRNVIGISLEENLNEAEKKVLCLIK